MREATRRPPEPDWGSHRRALHRFVRARVPEPATAEDIVQEILARALARRETLEDPKRLRQWLYAIARNAIADHYRSRRILAELPESLATEAVEREPIRELARCLPRFVESLPPPYRRAVELSGLEGLTQREAAARLGLSTSGAKSRVQRARRMLAARLRECCDLEFDGRGALASYTPRRDSGCSGDSRPKCSTPD